MICPRCGVRSFQDIDLHFGYRDQSTYHVGDTYAWISRKAVQNGGRPDNGTMDGEGYAECPVCHKDFFVIVHLRDDVIESVEPDPERPGYIQ